jgi:hypothetical protein
MNISAVQPVMGQVMPLPTREEMMIVAAARPAALQAQQVALHAVNSGTTGRGTPAVDPGGGIDLYA